MSRLNWLQLFLLILFLKPCFIYSQQGNVKYINRSSQRDADAFQRYDQANQHHDDIDYRHEYTAAAYKVAKSTSKASVGQSVNSFKINNENQVKASVTTSSENLAVRTRMVIPDVGYESKLNKYNVVVAALSKKSGVEQLKKVFSAEKEPIVVARNKNGSYYFILGSFSTRNQALTKRESLQRKYVNNNTISQRQLKYGLPLSDIWILCKE